MDINDTLAERQATHGTFSEGAGISQALCKVMYTSPNWDTISNTHKEALEMIQHKIARVLCGDPNFIDPFRDISGYAQLVQNQLMTTDGASDVSITKKLYHSGAWTMEKPNE